MGRAEIRWGLVLCLVIAACAQTSKVPSFKGDGRYFVQEAGPSLSLLDVGPRKFVKLFEWESSGQPMGPISRWRDGRLLLTIEAASGETKIVLFDPSTRNADTVGPGNHAIALQNGSAIAFLRRRPDRTAELVFRVDRGELRDSTRDSVLSIIPRPSTSALPHHWWPPVVIGHGKFVALGPDGGAWIYDLAKKRAVPFPEGIMVRATQSVCRCTRWRGVAARRVRRPTRASRPAPSGTCRCG